jgi:hypothetical protein
MTKEDWIACLRKHPRFLPCHRQIKEEIEVAGKSPSEIESNKK